MYTTHTHTHTQSCKLTDVLYINREYKYCESNINYGRSTYRVNWNDIRDPRGNDSSLLNNKYIVLHLVRARVRVCVCVCVCVCTECFIR